MMASPGCCLLEPHHILSDFPWVLDCWLQLQKTLGANRIFPTEGLVLVNGTRMHVYEVDPKVEVGQFWRAVPYVLASLLATRLPKNEMGSGHC
jgi:hypothetical protein